MAWTAGDQGLLQGSTSYLSMLHDEGRNMAYAAALKASDPHLVLDLGAGTGLLAALACKAHGNCSAVACEVYDQCAHVAELVLRENGLAERVKVVNKVASELELGEDLPEKADLCVFELFDSALLGESIIPILRDAKARLLKPNCQFIPRKVKVKAMLVSCPKLGSANVPELRGAAWPLMLGQLGLGGTEEVFVRRSEVWDAFEIDFAHLPSTPCAQVSHVKVSGQVEAVAWWWELDLGGQVHSSWTKAASPEETTPARHHWRPCISFLAPKCLAEGEAAITAAFDDEGVWFAWGSGLPPRWLEGVTSVPPERERFLMAFNQNFQAALAQLGREAGPNPMLLLAEDFLSLRSLAEVVKVAQVPLRPKAFARLVERGVWPEGFSRVEAEATASPETTVVVEPFVLGEARPWALCAHLARRLDRVEAKKALPSAVTIMAVLVECAGTWLARQPLGDLCGVSMAAANPFLVPQRPVPLECHLCETAWRPLSSPQPLLQFSLPGLCKGRGECRLEATGEGQCHAVVFWAEFQVTGRCLSTGPTSAPDGWCQAMQLLEKPVDLSAGSMLSVEMTVEDGEADILIDCSDGNASKRQRKNHRIFHSLSPCFS
eukprot:Skav233582  [mRNA]  locus=scaffold2520:159161:160975:+ [translate_table: standard]